MISSHELHELSLLDKALARAQQARRIYQKKVGILLYFHCITCRIELVKHILDCLKCAEFVSRKRRMLSHVIFYSLKIVVKCSCIQSSYTHTHTHPFNGPFSRTTAGFMTYTYRYNKMLWQQIVNNSNDIIPYHTIFV